MSLPRKKQADPFEPQYRACLQRFLGVDEETSKLYQFKVTEVKQMTDTNDIIRNRKGKA